MKTTWEQVMALKSADTKHQGVANTLTPDEIDTILALVDFFDGSVPQARFDLIMCKYRVFDWLAMCVMGGRIGSDNATKVLAYSFIKMKGDIDKFIQDLRETDYQIVTDWETLTLE